MHLPWILRYANSDSSLSYVPRNSKKVHWILELLYCERAVNDKFDSRVNEFKLADTKEKSIFAKLSEFNVDPLNLQAINLMWADELPIHVKVTVAPRTTFCDWGPFNNSNIVQSKDKCY